MSNPAAPQPTAIPMTAPLLKFLVLPTSDPVAVKLAEEDGEDAHSIFRGEPQSAALPMKAGSPKDRKYESDGIEPEKLLLLKSTNTSWSFARDRGMEPDR